MIYVDALSKDMFIFDKFGKWVKSGVEHECLNLSNTYDEKKWFDSFNHEEL
jgi:hypothetical protein